MSSKVTTNISDYDLIKPYMDSVPCESGHHNTTTGADIAWKIKNQVRLLTLADGNCTVDIDGREYVMRQNDLMFLFRDYSVNIHTDAGSVAELWWLDINGRGVLNFTNYIGISESNCMMQGVSNQGFLREMKNQVLYCSDMTASDALNAIGSLYRILAILVDECMNSAWTVVPYDSKEILYTGIWSKWPSPSEGQHNEVYTASARSYAELNFYGTGVKWYGTVNFGCGKADVIIDGVYQTTVDTYNPSRLPKQLLYSNTHLSAGRHIVKVFCTGESNYRAVNCDVVIESFQYLAPQEDNLTLRQGYVSGLVRRTVQYMNRNFSQEITVEQVAKDLNVSRPYLTSKFGGEMGLTPMQYLTNLRMSHSKQLLLTTELSVAEIAAAVGIKDPFYFSHFFKKNTGISPSHYRETHGKEATALAEDENEE